MERHHRFQRLATAAILLGFAQSAAGQDRTTPDVVLRVYNYSGVPADAMRGAGEKIVRIYRDAGVAIEWVDRLAEPARSAARSNAESAFAVRMMIRSKEVSERRGPASVMGMALEADDKGGTASVFFDQVVRTARRHGQTVTEILALAIAHEVGHLLLPPPSHSDTGIMRAEWNAADVRHAVVGQLLFTPGEASLIREKLAGCCR